MRGKKLTPDGTMVMFLETDLKKVPAFDEKKLTPLQMQVFSRLSSNEQEKIRAGYGTVVVDLKNDKQRCEFNMENYQPPQSAIDSFARVILPMIQEYYSRDENKRSFEEDTAKQDKDK